jgi:hypothetical protein
MIPIEITVKSQRVAKQNQLSHVDYESVMLAELDYIDEQPIATLNLIMIQKKKVALAYNKRIKPRSFSVGDMVWKVILPPRTKDHFLGKWSPNWEGPYLVSEVFEGNAYRLMHVNSDEHIRAINGKYLKLYKPSMNEIELKHKKY